MFSRLFGWLFGWKNTTTPKPPTDPPVVPPIDVTEPAGPVIPTDTNGEIELGHLDPVIPAFQLTPGMASLMHAADDVLNIALMNDPNSDWSMGLVNPFTSEPKDADGKPVVGSYAKGSDAFVGQGMVPAKMIFESILDKKDAQTKQVLTPLAAKISEAVWVPRPAMKFNVDGKPDNRIVFFKSDKVGGYLDIDNKDIDKLVEEAGNRNLRLIKQNIHFSADRDYTNYDMRPPNEGRRLGWPNAQGFRIEDLLSDDSVGPAGASHVGSWSLGYIKGKPVSIVSDWGWDTKGTCDYPSNIFAIDYQAGCRDLIPEATLKAYKQNADMWDTVASMMVPFSDTMEDEDRFRHFMYNPLECHDQATTVAAAQKISELDFPSFNEKYGGFYCSEGIFAVANFGPQADTLIKKSNFGPDNRLHKLIVEYQKAYDKPEYAGWTQQQKRENPQIGWQHLLDLGDANGGISQKQYNNLKYYSSMEVDGHLRRFGAYLDFIPEDVKGWQAYRPKNPQALIARPMSMSTIVWAVLRMYLPREAIAKAIAKDIGRAYAGAVASGDVAVQTAVRALIGGADPTTPQGQQALGGFAAIMAGGWLISVLSHNDVKLLILGKAGATFIKLPEDVPGQDPDYKDLSRWPKIMATDDFKALSAVYDKFIDALKDPSLITQDKLDQKLMELDEEACNVKVTWNVPNKVTGAVYKRTTLMKFLPPACWSFWARQDLFGSPSCVRYVGTAIRDYYKKPGVA